MLARNDLALPCPCEDGVAAGTRGPWCHKGMGTRISPARVLRASAQTPGPAAETRRKAVIRDGNQVYHQGSFQHSLSLSWGLNCISVPFRVVLGSSFFLASSAPSPQFPQGLCRVSAPPVTFTARLLSFALWLQTICLQRCSRFSSSWGGEKATASAP